MDELDRRLRDLIDAAAAPVTADEVRGRAATPLHETHADHRRRHRHRRLLAIAAAIVVLAGALTWSISRDAHDRVVTDDHDPSSATTSTAPPAETPPVTTTSTIPPAQRPPLADLAVAVTLDEVHVIDTRTGIAVQQIKVTPALSADSRTRTLEFVAVAPDKHTAIVTAAEHGSGRYSLWTVDLRSGAVGMLSNDAIWPAFSPDGATVSFTRSQGPREGGDTIVLRDLATGRERELIRHADHLEGLSRITNTVWAPDNRTLAYNFGYYGADTYLVDTSTATDLDNARKLDRVAFIDWRAPDRALAAWFCCFEAEPAVVSDYSISTGAHTPARVPERFGLIDRNDQDDRLAGRDESTGQYVARYTTAAGELIALPGYRHVSW